MPEQDTTPKEPVEPPKEGEDLIPKEDLPQDKPGKEPDKPTDAPTEPKEPDAPVEPPVEPPVESIPAIVPSQPVPGETPKESALRLEVTRLRTKLRSEGVKQIVEDVVVAKPDEDPYKALREKGYSSDEIQQMEIAVDLIAKNKGYVRAEDSYKQNIQDSIDTFIDDHPEYKPTQDDGDIRWGEFQRILQGGIYNIANKTPRQLKSIFSKVDEDVKKQIGEPITVKLTPEQIAAQKHKVQIASHSGGTKPTSTPESKIDLSKPIGGVTFKGFDSEDFKEEKTT